jgi:anaerobic magnesium-protoporphyrin IX monomethyl ester cyclase
MKKAILCFPDIKSSQSQYPTGLYKIATFCQEFYETIVIDERIEDATKEINKLLSIYKDDILCIGLSVMTGEQIESAHRLSEIFYGRTKIVWGGIHPSILPQQTISDKFIDYLIIGEGEEAFLSLLRYLDTAEVEKYSESFYNNTRFCKTKYNFINNLNNYVDFESYPIKEDYIIERDGFKRAFNIETSRGCPFHCSYCHNSIFNKSYRSMDSSSVIKIIEYLISNYNIDGIIFQEDNFFVNKARTLEITNFLKNKNVGWKANSRIDYFYKLMEDHSTIKSIIDSNCRTLQFGIESGSSRILKLINKKITIEQVLKTNSFLKTLPINVRYNFMIGFPTETLAEIRETENFIHELMKANQKMESPFVNIYTPYPGTKLFDLAIKEGFIAPSNLMGWSKYGWNNSRLTYLDDDTYSFVKKLSNEFLEKVNYPI